MLVAVGVQKAKFSNSVDRRKARYPQCAFPVHRSTSLWGHIELSPGRQTKVDSR